ncbi:MAG: hypothetical protein E7453_03490 [Ruminococcaceae bacterium]|nr:hypothetical protein [Oscillospiraceae bacterium]
MSIYQYETAFGAADKTSRKMRQAMEDWEALYYGTGEGDPCQRIAYTVVSKLVSAIFGECQVTCDPALLPLTRMGREAMQKLLMSGECYIKPCPTETGFSYTLVPRQNVLVFGRDADGRPSDIGTAEKSVYGKHHYTLLERRTVEGDSLVIQNTLYRSTDGDTLGAPVSLSGHPLYEGLAEKYRFEELPGLGLIQMKVPILNCVDGSHDGVAIFAPAIDLIRNIDKNEEQLCGEFTRGESRVFASADLIDGEKGLSDHLFVGLDEGPENVGITVFSPKLREESYLARKQEYLRNVESIIGLRRGMLSDAQIEDRTATEITSSAADFNLLVISCQQVWEQAARETAVLCNLLSRMYRLPKVSEEVVFDWGNGVLFDEDKTWAEYMEMVKAGLIAPEVALGWRFNMPCETEEERAEIKRKYMIAEKASPV